jgi:hypothetical protein
MASESDLKEVVIDENTQISAENLEIIPYGQEIHCGKEIIYGDRSLDGL